MEKSGYNKDNIGAKLQAKLNKWLTFDFNARMAYQKIKGLSGGADTNVAMQPTQQWLRPSPSLLYRS